MSASGARQSLRDRLFGGRNVSEEDPLVRLLRDAVDELEPDALFRRRVRGAILNRHVALREGLIKEQRPRRSGVIGRAALLSSLTLVVSVSAAGAASQSSLPGELLYPMKRQLEEIRLQMATGSARRDLLSTALAERLDELERLATVGEWTEVAAASAQVTVAERALAAGGKLPHAAQRARLEGHTARLEDLLNAAPAAERPGLQQALRTSTARAQGRPTSSGGNAGPGVHDSGRQGSGAEHEIPNDPGVNNGSGSADQTHPPHPSPATGDR